MVGSKMTMNETQADAEIHNDENVSALLDGETSHLNDNDIKALIENHENRESWARYQLIGDILRESNVDSPAARPSNSYDQSVAERVRTQIEAEPTVLAPRGSNRRLPKYLQPVAGLAIAASVAGLAVIGIQQMSPQGGGEPQQISVANLEAAEQVMAETVVADAGDATPELEIDLAEHKRRLNSYLVNFNEQRTSLGMPGVNPYVRIIDFESEK